MIVGVAVRTCTCLNVDSSLIGNFVIFALKSLYVQSMNCVGPRTVLVDPVCGPTIIAYITSYFTLFSVTCLPTADWHCSVPGSAPSSQIQSQGQGLHVVWRQCAAHSHEQATGGGQEEANIGDIFCKSLAHCNPAQEHSCACSDPELAACTSACAHKFIHKCPCLHVHGMCVCMCVCICVCVMCVYMCVCMCVCAHVHHNTQLENTHPQHKIIYQQHITMVRTHKVHV